MRSTQRGSGALADDALPGVEKNVEPLRPDRHAAVPGRHACTVRYAQSDSRLAAIGAAPGRSVDRVEDVRHLRRGIVVAGPHALHFGHRPDHETRRRANGERSRHALERPALEVAALKAREHRESRQSAQQHALVESNIATG